MSFREVIGQTIAVEFLKDSLRKQRIAQAYLFVGPEGTGKRTLAKNFAKSLNCEVAPSEGSDCCDQCDSCRKIDAFSHPDVSWVQPEALMESIKIEQIRQIRRNINLRPYQGRTKVYIISEAHQLSEEASNALLKTLEESPKDSVLVLTSSFPDRLLPTVISRTQKVILSSLGTEETQRALVLNWGLSKESAQFLANFSEGRLGKALRLRQKDALRQKNRIIDEKFLASEDRGETEEALEVLIAWLRDILISKVSSDSSLLINLDRKKEIFELKEKLSFEDLQSLIGDLIQTRDFIQLNLNLKLVKDALKIKMRQFRCTG